MQRILRNRIKCNTCGDIIESTYTHDFVSCSCGRVSVDGGKDYLRRCFKESQEDYTDLSEFNSLTPLSKAEICKILYDVSPTTVEAVLGAMVKRRTIRHIGSARSARYRRV